MEDNIKSTIKEVAHSLSEYVDSKDLRKIEECFQNLFAAFEVKFWKYDDRAEELYLVGNKNLKKVSFESSLIKQSIETKLPLLVNHLTSDKYFVPDIDNPLAFKVKALLIFPIVKERNVLGVMKIWRGMNQRKVFTKQDEKVLESLSSLLVKIIERKEIEKTELMSLLGEDISRRDFKTPVKKIPMKKTPLKNEKKFENHQKIIDTLNTDIEVYSKEQDSLKEKISTLEKQKEKYKTDLNDLKQKNKELSSKKQEFETKYRVLESSALEFSTDIKVYQKENQKITSELEILMHDYSDLQEQLKKNNNNTKSIKELKSENAILLQSNSINIEDNLECILHQVVPLFAENELSYILFELMLYASSSNSSMSDIEGIVKKSKLLSEMIEKYHRGVSKVNNEKTMISNLSNTIIVYGKNIFPSSSVIHIDVLENVPSSLILDAPKVQSILYHLLIDMYQFIDYSKDLNVEFKYKKKILTITLVAAIHQNNSLFKSMFKQSKLAGNEKDRLGLLLSHKLIEGLKGKIESAYDDTHYTFIMTLPSEKIKI